MYVIFTIQVYCILQMSIENRRVVGYKVTNDEFNILQAYANEMYNFQVPDPSTNTVRRMIEEPKVGLLIKEASLCSSDNSIFLNWQLYLFKIHFQYSINNFKATIVHYYLLIIRKYPAWIFTFLCQLMIQIIHIYKYHNGVDWQNLK